MSTHWSKDYVEHLRTVHFALVVACITLVLLSTSQTPNEIQIAHRQLREIRETTSSLKLDPSWIDKHVTLQLKKNEEHLGQPLPFPRPWLEPRNANTLEITEGSRHTTLHFTFDRTYVLRLIASGRDDQDKDRVKIQETPDVNLAQMADASTLSDFRSLWDAMDNNEFHIVIASGLQPTAYIRRTTIGPFAAAKVRFTNSLETRQRVVPFSLSTCIGLSKLEPHDVASASGEFCYTALLFGEKLTLINIPVDGYMSFPFDGQSALIERNSTWQHGTFSYSFAQLDNISKDYQGLELSTIDRILTAEEKRTGERERFEAFGIKFPAEGTTRWGILLILGVQVYFWLHLRELSANLAPKDPGLEVAWIGIYRFPIARITMFISVVVLPLWAALALSVHGLSIESSTGRYRAALIVAVTAVSGMGMLIWKRLPRKKGTGDKGDDTS